MIKRHSMQKRATGNNTTASIPLPDVFPDTPEDPSHPRITYDDTAPRMDAANTYYEYIYNEVNSSVFTVTVNKLKHFTYYSISVKACREGLGDSCGMLPIYSYISQNIEVWS